MDPIRALDMEFRSGISPSEVDDFATRMDLISQAMEEIKNGTFDPNKCKIPGYKTPEQEEAERLEAIKREEERVRREQERERKRKHEERENWWMKAKLRFSVEEYDDDNDNQYSTSKQGKAQFAASRALAAYKERDANDYSIWANWEPQDPVTLQENAERDALLEKQRNKEFEANNPDFCSQFKEDLEKRQRTKQEKERIAEKCKQQGNLSYKKKQYKAAIHSYMQALDKAPFNIAVLTNLAQCHLRMSNLDDAVEFSSRALFVNPEHVKALSRRAAARHLQKRWKDAAVDMEKALLLEPGNQDVVEQHSIIVGDYEDSIAQIQLEVKLANAETCESGEEHTKVYELQFLAELFKRMEGSCRSGMGNQELQEDQKAETENQLRDTSGVVHPSWIAYELVLPFLEKNESARTLFRTSSELHKLCSRLVGFFELKQVASANKGNDSDKDRELIVSAMINCAAAAMDNCPRNQIVMYQNASFRKCILAALIRTAVSYSEQAKVTSLMLPWSTRASVLRLFEEAVKSKSWKRAMTATKSVLPTLLTLIQLSGESNENTNNNNGETLTKFDRVSKQNLVLTASSVCFTLSSDDHGIREFAHEAQGCIQAVASALKNWKVMDTRLLPSLLGFLTNLSTVEAFRAAVEGLEGSERLRLVQDLLSIAHEAAVGNSRRTSSKGEAQLTTAEHALAALLNLSFHADARIRVDLITCDFITTLSAIFSAMDRDNFNKLVLVFSRAISLLCRVHPVMTTTTGTANDSALRSAKFTQTTKQLTDRDLLELLYRMCLQALSSTYTSTSDADNNQLSGETWQLCAQIWCHVGWCVHELHVREYLREKRAVHAMFQAIVLSNEQTEGYRSSASSSSQETSARERLVGNIVKVLITMQSDRNQQDAKLFTSSKNLKALVNSLRSLPSGLARKNVAILLAKLCQADQKVKDQVRELRGIDMMLTVSQSLKTVGGKG